MSKVALIDGDSILYKVGFALEEEIENEDGTVTHFVDFANAKDFIDGMIDGILFNTDCDNAELWVGERGANFRYKLAADNLADNYKYNRKDSRKPDKYKEMLAYIKKKYKSMSPLNCEVDDVVCYKLAEKPDEYVLCAIDKDVLYQSVGRHYNYGKDEWVTVTQEEALYFAYFQTLTGDTTDGYKGCRLIGPAKAIAALGVPNGNSKMLLDILKKGKVKPEKIKELMKGSQHSERTLWAKVLLCYRKAKMKKSDAYTTMRLAQMHQLSRNSKGKLRIKFWTPPKKGEELIDALKF